PLRPVVGVPPSCTLFGTDASGAWQSQVPKGRWVVTSAQVRTGPRVGPMVFTAVESMRSQAGGGFVPPAGAICCRSSVESQVFTPPPNSVFTLPVRMPVKNTVELIDNEPVEVVDYI